MVLAWTAYYRLMRFHKPIGLLLLWAPTAWSLWMANGGYPGGRLFFLFFMGTVFMRAAGCVMNDIADRKIDRHVTRTKERPLTSGEVTLNEAMVLLLVLFSAAFLILLQLPFACFPIAVLGGVISIIYPFCKRFLQCPQLVLGVAFSVGIPMAYLASPTSGYASMFYLFIINFLWILSYDTQYAMADRVDDLKIGVKSSAILFGAYDRVIIAVLQIIFHGLWLILAYVYNFSSFFLVGWGAGSILLIYQQQLLKTRQPNDCLRAFSSNGWYGLIMWLSLMIK